MNNPLNPSIVKIRDVRVDTYDTKTFVLKLRAPFDFKPGQFNMVGYPGVGEAPISISSLMKNSCIEHTIRAVGRVTDFLSSLKRGDDVFLRGSYGRGWPVHEVEGNDLILVAGGVGLAPLRPVIQTVIERRNSFGNVVLIYGSRNEKNALYKDESEMWKGSMEVLITIDEVIDSKKWKHGTGSVITLLNKALIRSDKTYAFVCGPEIMMRFACNSLLMNGISASRLYVSLERRMKCGIGHCGHCQHGGRFVCKEGPVFPYREVRGLPDGML